MKVNFLFKFYSKNALVKKINKRHLYCAKHIHIKKGLNPEDVKFLSSNRETLGRFAANKRVTLEFSPLEQDLFCNTKLDVHNYTSKFDDSEFLIEKYKLGNTKFLDKTISNDREKLENIKQLVNMTLEEHKEFVSVLKRIIFAG